MQWESPRDLSWLPTPLSFSLSGSPVGLIDYPTDCQLAGLTAALDSFSQLSLKMFS